LEQPFHTPVKKIEFQFIKKNSPCQPKNKVFLRGATVIFPPGSGKKVLPMAYLDKLSRIAVFKAGTRCTKALIPK
jgi:hypothetical protein